MRIVKENKECANRTATTFRSLMKQYGPKQEKGKLMPITTNMSVRNMFIEFIDKYYPDFFEDEWYEPSEYASMAVQFGQYMTEEHGHSRYGCVVKDKIKEYLSSKIREAE